MRKKKTPKEPSEIFKVLFQPKVTKSQRTQLSIAEGVVASCFNVGIEDTNFESVANELGLSRSIVNKYFPTKTSMILFTAKYVRSTFQDFVLNRMTPDSGPKELLHDYVIASLSWPETYPKHSAFWMLIHHYSGSRKEFREFATEVAEMGRSRVRDIIQTGARAGQFKPLALEDIGGAVHAYLSGAVLLLMTENHSSAKKFKHQVASNVLRLVGVR